MAYPWGWRRPGRWPRWWTRLSFNPLSLFAAGEQGAWYDPSDFASLFQDTAGTIPVTATGQSVARINDKSGRGNHATQSTAGSCPTLQQDGTGRYYLSFDGVDDFLVTGNVNLTASNKLLVCAGLRKSSDATTGIFAEFSALWVSNAGTFAIGSPGSPSANFSFSSRGSLSGGSTLQTGFAAPFMAVICGIGDIANDRADLRVNGTQYGVATADQGAGNYGNFPIYIGRRGGTTLPFTGRMYGMILRGTQASAGQIAQAEAWMNAKTGAY